MAENIPFHAGPGTRHEVGVMVGFMVLFVLSMGVYLVFWRCEPFPPPPTLVPTNIFSFPLSFIG